MNRMEPMLLRAAADALAKWENDSDKVQREALTLSLELPLWLRRHGLLATLALLFNKGGNVESRFAEAFADALHAVAPIGQGTNSRARIAHLATETLAAYLLHSRVALALADAWVRLAEPLLPKAAAKPAQRDPVEEAADATQ